MRFLLIPLLGLSLLGCQSTQKAGEHSAMLPLLPIPFTEPLQPDPRAQIEVARYSELLNSPELTRTQRAELYHIRGKLYDSLGLPQLAQIDFNRALKLKPDLAETYNFLGIHHTLRQEFTQAYERFDSVLELDESYEYAYLNRGIALYYGDRAELAVDDFTRFLASADDDAYRVLWLFLAQNDVDPVVAKEQLAINSQKLSPSAWSTQIVQLYLNQLNEEQFLAGVTQGVQSQKEYAERLCEAYFYIAKRHLRAGNDLKAAEYFRLTLATNVYEFVEHKYAKLELQLLRQALLQKSAG
ncbi:MULTISPECIES: lipoprotein NlpI [Pseudoalteromonas]|uniref:lipoprotein NlpI n=1 Tax=Pseudoalteromonas TaxID=53246 RepID=UPI00056CB36B|nr:MULTISPECIES: lipoprotein NlpI [Pseudoalteromonas]MCG7548844.1 lipoprotein NlpI [Pseudoalteromonas sp. Of7M-16]